MEVTRERGKSLETIKKLISARQSLIYVVTWEEDRLERLVDKLAKTMFSTPVKFFVWQATTGLILGGKPVEGTKDPMAALDRVMAIEENALFLFKDLHQIGRAHV